MPSNKTQIICPLTGRDPASMKAAMAAAADAGADAVEFRLDYLDRPPRPQDLQALLADAPVATIVTYRPRCQGGRYDGPEGPRLLLLQQAAKHEPYFIDVELGTSPDVWPQAAIILSFHDFDRCPPELAKIVASMGKTTAAVRKVAFAATAAEDFFQALDILRGSPKPTIAIAMGDMGLPSRILARKFGAFGTFASLQEGAASAPGQSTIEQLRSLYRWDSIGPATQVYGVIGHPVAHSMSPAIHNAAFTAKSMDAVYVPLLVPPGADNFKRFMDALLARPWMDWRGLSVTIPHKENALAYVGESNCDELARKIGAVNTITIGPGGKLRGDNTDYAAAIDSLCAAMGIGRAGLKGQAVAVLGAGGAARAIVAALTHYGASVSLYNRTLERARSLGQEFGAKAATLDSAVGADAAIVINCTPIGMHPNIDMSPLPRIPTGVRAVFDTIYNPIETRLLAQARQAGLVCVSGLDMFVNQAVAQFEIWTGAKAPRDVMREVVVKRLTMKE